METRPLMETKVSARNWIKAVVSSSQRRAWSATGSGSPIPPSWTQAIKALAVHDGDIAFGDALGPLSERALAIREKALGPEHPDTATSLNNLGLLL
jgi:hypothetical protein